MAWFKKTRKPIASTTAESPSRVPEGLWTKCPGCAQLIYKNDLEENLNVCPKCGHHNRLSARRRLDLLLDGEGRARRACAGNRLRRRSATWSP